ncbi:MAG: carboxypeptidase-like regulatory domain-containing protein [Bacteroidota bacterium]|nr:carboxypeptidase-like regulatory domain-containing protein [Candidatus Kapabacteria bacterium]MDW8220869.1 carboxypeptidase-like regulatory domain-containing protein [Bacteroidota bacterium]
MKYLVPSLVLRYSARKLLNNVFLITMCAALLLGPSALYAQQNTGVIRGRLILASTVSTLTGMLGNVPIRFTSTTDATFFTVFTSPDGSFLSRGVTLGTYSVRIAQPPATTLPQTTIVTVSTDAQAELALTFVPALPQISGQLLRTEAGRSVPFPFASVLITSRDARLIAPVDSLGQFALTVSTASTYTLTPTTSTLRANFAFAPRFFSVTVDSSGIVSTSPTFRAFEPEYRIRGIVRSTTQSTEPPITGSMLVRIERLSTTGSVIGTIFTSASVSSSGEEFIVSVTNGIFRLSFQYSQGTQLIFTITPSVRLVGVTDANVDIGTVLIGFRRLSIRGRIITTNGTLVIPLQQVPVRIEQAFSRQRIADTLTDNEGNFAFSVEAFRYIATPVQLVITLKDFTFVSNDGQAFDSVLALGILQNDISLGTITAVRAPDPEFPLHGRILYPDRSPLAETTVVTAIITNANSIIPITRQVRVSLAPDGRYRIEQGITSGIFRISLQSPNHVFTPSIIEVTMPRDAGFDVNFTVTMVPILISGRVQTVLGEPVVGVLMRVSGSANGVSARTDALGRYSMQVPGQYPGSRWNVFPSQDNTIFTPLNRLIVTRLDQLALGGMDFRVTSTTTVLQLSSISGRVSTFDDRGREQGLRGVTISDGTRSTQTDENGHYTLRGVPNGTYTLTPSLSGYVFTPPTLQASIIGGNSARNQNFVSQAAKALNRSPFVAVPINDVSIITASTTPIPLGAVFSDPDGDTLALVTIIEDQTLLRTRIRQNTLLLDALSEGNTMVSVIATDNRGGTTTASFRVFVGPPFATPRLFVRPRNVNTNINASIVIEPRTLFAFAGLPTSEKGNAELASLSGELGAFNSKCECVGSIVWTGNNAVLTVWGEDAENNIPGMKVNDPIHIRFIDNIERRSRRTRAIYFYNITPGPWPIDQAIVTAIPELEDDQCAPVQNIALSAHTSYNPLEVTLTPNPIASGKATLSYTMPSGGNVHLELWNMLGQCVHSTSIGYRSSGHHRFDINLEHLPTGTYLCRLYTISDSHIIHRIATVRFSIIR